MTVVGAIPARWGSTRLPGKSLVEISGKPLIQWVIEGVQKARGLDQLVVATDDERISAVAEGLGVKAVMTRAEHPSGTDRIAEALAGVEGDIVINIQGDEPLIDASLIDRLAEIMQAEEDWDMATAAAPIEDTSELNDSSVVKVVWGENHRALYFSRSAIPFVRDGAGESAEPIHWRHLGLYAYRRAFLERLVASPPSRLEQLEKLEQLRALHLGARMTVLETEDTGLGVDTPDDVKRVEAMIKRLHGG